MELYQLRYFKVLAEMEHFTRAAEALHIAQPSLSKAISNLEGELGLALFERGKRGVYLNEYGRTFLKQVNQILYKVEEAEQELQEIAGNSGGDIYLASCAIFNAPSKIYTYQEQFFFSTPQVGLHMYILDATQIEEMLLNHKIDLGFSTSKPQHFEVEATELFSLQMGVVMSKDHPLAGRKAIHLAELKDEKFLCNNTSPDNRDSLYEMCHKAGFEPRVVFEGESADLIGKAVGRNIGVAFITKDRHIYQDERSERNHWDDNLVFVDILDDFCLRTVYLYQLKDRYLIAPVRHFRDGLLEYCRSPRAPHQGQ